MQDPHTEAERWNDAFAASGSSSHCALSPCSSSSTTSRSSRPTVSRPPTTIPGSSPSPGTTPAGEILSSDGVVLAKSVPSTGYYKYRRVYDPSTATLFSQIVGYDTIFGTRTGVEAYYNNFLSRAPGRPSRSPSC